MDSLIPVIDVAAHDTTASLGAALGRAARDIGFFVLTDHGIPSALMSDVFAQSKRFFAAPIADKQRLSISHSPHNRGYVALAQEKLDPSKPGDYKEAFNIGLELPPGHPELVAGRPFRGANAWPDAAAMPAFRDTLLQYFDACHRLGVLLHQALAHDLGIPAHDFDDKLDAPLATLRLLHYPPRPAHYAPGQTGAGVHTDYGNLTLLATDDAGGLEVQTRSGTWVSPPSVPHAPHALIVNIGDCLMRWTNDVYASTPHRVLNPMGRDRYSVAFFLDANPDAMVAALPSCVSDARPARYPPIRCVDYIAARLDATYAHRSVSAEA